MPFDPTRGSDHARAYATKLLEAREMVLPRNGRRWLEELVKGKDRGHLHGI